MQPGRNILHPAVPQNIYPRRVADVHILPELVLVRGQHARLPVVVQPPREDPPALVDGEVVAEAREDGRDLVLLEDDAVRGERLVAVAEDEAAAELALVADAPGVDGALAGEGQDMIGASGEVGDVPEGGDADRLSADYLPCPGIRLVYYKFFLEAYDGLVALGGLVVSRAEHGWAPAGEEGGQRACEGLGG